MDPFSRYNKIFGREKFLIYVADARGVYVLFNTVSCKESDPNCDLLAPSFLRIFVTDARQIRQCPNLRTIDILDDP